MTTSIRNTLFDLLDAPAPLPTDDPSLSTYDPQPFITWYESHSKTLPEIWTSIPKNQYNSLFAKLVERVEQVIHGQTYVAQHPHVVRSIDEHAIIHMIACVCGGAWRGPSP